MHWSRDCTQKEINFYPANNLFWCLNREKRIKPPLFFLCSCKHEQTSIITFSFSLVAYMSNMFS